MSLCSKYITTTEYELLIKLSWQYSKDLATLCSGPRETSANLKQEAKQKQQQRGNQKPISDVHWELSKSIV